MTDTNGVFGSLEEKSSMLFLVAGGLLAVFAVNTGLETFAGTFYPAIQSIVGPAGFFLGVVGLLGLYPALADRTSTIPHIAAVVAGVASVCWFVIVVGGLGEFGGVFPSSEEILPGMFFIAVFVFTILSYLIFGLVSFRTGVQSRTISSLLFGPAAMFLLLVVGAAPAFVIDIGHVLFHLGIGLTLRAGGIPTDRTQPTPDSTA